MKKRRLLYGQLKTDEREALGASIGGSRMHLHLIVVKQILNTLRR